MGIHSTGYDIVLLLHILCVIVGFGSVFLNGVYAVQGKRRGGISEVAIAEATDYVSYAWAEKFIWAVPIFGFALVGMSQKVFTFFQLWIWLSIVLYLAGLVIATFAMKPISKKIRGLLGELSSSGSSCGCTGGSEGCGSEAAQNCEKSEDGACEEKAKAAPTSDALREKAQQMVQLDKRRSMLGGVLHLLLIAVLYLMVFTPGGPRI